MQYYHNLSTTKSFQILQELKKAFQFILIGGWAIWIYTKALKSKDIDFICDYKILGKLKNKFDISKNNRLKKYEAKIEEIDIDIYLPFYSDLGLPAQEIKKYTKIQEGFQIPRPEILLILKQKAYQSRKDSIKGEKDKIDILSLLLKVNLDFNFYKKILARYNLKIFLQELKNIILAESHVKELGLNKHQYSRFKSKILKLIQK
ncbi:MAG: hypothetical protein ABII94_01635 [Patescibacteria group bacterium]|nr:hypothetical protein [Patescibacteria group bacterium]MBU1420859.1 hypothetical protein [Patescibacteria group bacterium]MBU1987622.1 hypothetical protein [Patescibacteria group bacterium]MBU2415745.1 hypothetical protein [Patescibacteria group bacterium]MBU2456657.1 hypothetical protein [Patescibacteria group bacterium]